MKAVVAAFNQEKALVGAFSVIVQPVLEPMDRFAALLDTHQQSKVFQTQDLPSRLHTDTTWALK